MAEVKVLNSEVIKAILPKDVLCLKSVRGSLNDIKEPGYYEANDYNGRNTDFPVGAYTYGLLIVIAAGNFVGQIYLPHQALSKDAYMLYVRMSYNGYWVKWSGIHSTSLAT